jgi:dimethylargininase
MALSGDGSKAMDEIDRLFDVAFVRPPPDSYANCVSTNPSKSDIDVTLAREQHRAYVSILNESGVRVIELPTLESHPDSVFMQDPAVLGSSLSVIGRFGEGSRRGEEEALVNDLAPHNRETGKLKTVGAPGTLEGGDIVVTTSGIFVGESQRTNSNGTEQLATYLKSVRLTSIRTDLLHLLCGCSYLSDGTMIIAPELLNPSLFPGFRFVTISEQDAYAADALYVGEGRVLIPSGFPRTANKLRKTGYKPVEVEMSEFYKGDGGVTCLSSPVYRVF